MANNHKTKIFIILMVLQVLFIGCESNDKVLDYESTIIEKEVTSISDSNGWVNYKDYDNDSGVSSYRYGDTYIQVEFTSGKKYLYTYESAGKENIENMKKLAEDGNGLNSYINKNVRDKYESYK